MARAGVLAIAGALMAAASAHAQVSSIDFYQNDLRTNRTFTSGPPCDLAYLDAGLRVRNSGSDMSCQFNVYEAGYFANNVGIEVSAALVRGSTESGFGIKFGNANQDNSLYYYFAINANGGYRMSLRSDGSWHELMDFSAGDKVRRGVGEWNRLRVELKGERADVYANGQWVAGTQLPMLAIGRIGFYLNDPGMEVVFRDLRVSQLPNTSPSEAASPFVYQQVGAAMDNGAFTTAERQARIYTQSFPNDARGHRLHSSLLLIVGNDRESLAAARRAVVLEPKNADYRGELAGALLRISDHQAAVVEYREAIRLGSQSSLVRARFVEALLNLNLVDEAVQVSAQALAMAKGSTEIAAAHHVVGLAKLARQDVPGAMQAFGDAIRLDSRMAPAYYGLGRAHERIGQRQEALTAYRAALQIAPKSDLYQAAVRRLGG